MIETLHPPGPWQAAVVDLIVVFIVAAIALHFRAPRVLVAFASGAALAMVAFAGAQSCP